MSHPPVENHPLRPVHRALAGLTGLFLVLFGVLGLVETADAGAFARLSSTALGIRTNLAFSVFALVVGALALGATLIGRNVDAFANKVLGVVLWLVGTAVLAALRTDVNIFNGTVTAVIVLYLAGVVLLTAGLYSRVAVRARA